MSSGATGIGSMLTTGADDSTAPSKPNGNATVDIEKRTVKESDQPRDFPLSWKLTALACGVFLSVGSSFSENTLGPLKSTLKKELEINNSQYGAISAATSLVNTILPIVGGYALDYYGVEWGSLACSIAIFIGAVVSALGSNRDTFGLVMAGRIIMGFGSTVIESCTSKILAHWFQHRGLGMVYGVDLSFGKLIVLMAKATAVPMRDASAFWGWALWIPAIVCFVNLLQNIFYIWWARSRPEWAQIPTGKALARRSSQRVGSPTVDEESPAAPAGRTSSLPDWKILLRVPRFFWLVVLTQILQAGIVGSWSGLNADIIRLTRGSTDQIAGYTSAVQQVIPVVLAPIIGGVFDFFGYRMLFVSITSAIWILVYCLIGFSHVNALGAMVIASLAAAMNALPFLASIPLMVPNQIELGLALGIWKAFNNCGSVIVDMIAGRLQDMTPGGTYEKVITFFVAWKALEFCLGLFYGLLDRRFLGGVLSMSETQRLSLEKEGKLRKSPGHSPSKVATTWGLAMLSTLVIVAWVLFIKYSI